MTTTYDAAIPYNSEISYQGTPSIATPSSFPTYVLEATTKEGVVGIVPDIKATVNFEFSAAGSISVENITAKSFNSALVKDLTVLRLLMNGQDVPDGKWMLRVQGRNSDSPNKARTMSGKSLHWDALERTIVWNDRRYVYSAKSCGYILNDLFSTADLRGARVGDFTWAFTAALDSFGNAWPEVVDIEYKPGAKYSDIVANMVDRELIEIRLLGNVIQVAVAGKMGATKPIKLSVGQDITESPITSSGEDIASDVMVVGEDDVTVVRSNTVTRATYGREETSVSQGGTKDLGTLSIIGDATLSQGDHIRAQHTYGIAVSMDTSYHPLRDYLVSDWIIVNRGEGESYVTQRLRQMSLRIGDDAVSGSLVANDRFLESELRLAKKVAGIIGGATITGSSRTSTPDDLKDTGIPKAPVGLILSADSYQDNYGKTRGVVAATWTPVTQNVDLTTATDISGYRVVWKYSGTADKTKVTIESSDTDISWSPVDPGRYVDVWVYAVDSSGNVSGASGVQNVKVATDTTAPNAPSTPIGTSFLKTVNARWDGFDSVGGVMPADFFQVWVYTSAADGFAASEGQLRGALDTAGTINLFGHTIGEKVYIKFVAVDQSGNKSADSAQTLVTVSGVSGVDLNANTITANNIQAGAVTAVAIKAGAVTTDKVTVGQTMNLVQDPGFSDAAWRARRITSEFVEKPGFYAFDNWSGIARSGYYLQVLSTPSGEGGGKFYFTDLINVQMGEMYYVGATVRNGNFTPNVDARFHLGLEVVKTDGSIVTDQITYAPTTTWAKVDFEIPAQADWAKVRFWLRAITFTAGDMAVDDLEVRSAVGTTALNEARGQLTPTGLRAWDIFDNQTIDMDFRTGDFIARGSLISGFSGKRVEINPGVTLLPEIRFYPTTGTLFSYINSSDTGSFPFIGMNAPDTGASSVCTVMYDTGFQLGEINKALNTVAGPAITSSGSGAAGFITFYGKMDPNPGTGLAAMYASSYAVAANTVSLTINKIATPTSGQFVPHYSLIRITGVVFRHHVSANSAASYTVIFEVNATIATTVNELVLRTT